MVYVWTGFSAILLFVLTLVLEGYVVILLVALVLVAIHFKSRLADRNVVRREFYFLLISGFVYP